MDYDSDATESGSDKERDSRLSNKHKKKKIDSNVKLNDEVRTFFTKKSQKESKCNLCNKVS